MKVLGLGRLTADPELKTVQMGEKEVSVVNFTVAYNEFRGKSGDKTKETHFYDCEAWDTGARVLAEYMSKGDMIFIEGKLREHRWKNAAGENRRRLVIRVEQFEMLGRRANQVSDNDSNDDDTSF